ncbi:DUF5343 domain-containing protein [Candidatus Latescibacterota bacterium]
MGNTVYATVPSRIPSLLEKIREVGKPEKATKIWLSAIGFTSDNDRRLISVLKFINFLDGSGVPTDKWKEYRNNNYKKVLAQAIKQGYSSLFETYPNANEKTNEELEGFFRAESNAGAKAINLIRLTFKYLCESADFSSLTDEILPNDKMNDDTQPGPMSNANSAGKGDNHNFNKCPVININIQLTLPETKDVDIYDKLFTSMKKNLFSGDNS